MPIDSARTSGVLDRVAIGLASARARLQWLDANARAQSRRAIDAIVGPVRNRDALARQYLRHNRMRERFIRRPWMVTGTVVDGAEHLRAARMSGRGVLVSYCHLGPFPGIAATVVEHAEDVHQVAGSWLASPRPETILNDRWHAWRSIFHRAGVPLVDAEGCFDTVTALLRRGAVVVIAFDWPGSAETMFLGRPAWLASGTARFASATGALIVPVMRQFRRLRVHTIFGAPLDPRGHGTSGTLHQALATRHEEWILRQPTALEDPRRPGAWEATATAERWGPRERGTS